MAKAFKCALIDHYFLYLPLLYAEARGYFGFLPDGYSLEIKTIRDATDKSILSTVLDMDSQQGRSYDLGVCDPMAVFESKSSAHQPAILCSLVANAAFWAVDRHVDGVRSYRDIPNHYSSVIAYPPGTTSNLIAHRIKHSSNPHTIEIVEVAPLAECDELKKRSGAIALSPDLLTAVKMADSGDFKIHFSFADSHEYCDILLSCLVTRRELVTEHPDFIRGLMKAIQTSVFRIHRRDDEDVREFAQRSEWWSDLAGNVPAALDRARQDRVFPIIIELNRPQWMKSAEAHFTGKKGDFSDLDQTSASDEFEKVAAPHLHICREAFMSIVAPPEAPPEAPPRQAVGDGGLGRIQIWRWALPTELLLFALSLLTFIATLWQPATNLPVSNAFPALLAGLLFFSTRWRLRGAVLFAAIIVIRFMPDPMTQITGAIVAFVISVMANRSTPWFGP